MPYLADNNNILYPLSVVLPTYINIFKIHARNTFYRFILQIFNHTNYIVKIATIVNVEYINEPTLLSVANATLTLDMSDGFTIICS